MSEDFESHAAKHSVLVPPLHGMCCIGGMRGSAHRGDKHEEYLGNRDYHYVRERGAVS